MGWASRLNPLAAQVKTGTLPGKLQGRFRIGTLTPEGQQAFVEAQLQQLMLTPKRIDRMLLGVKSEKRAAVRKELEAAMAKQRQTRAERQAEIATFESHTYVPFEERLARERAARLTVETPDVQNSSP